MVACRLCQYCLPCRFLHGFCMHQQKQCLELFHSSSRRRHSLHCQLVDAETLYLSISNNGLEVALIIFTLNPFYLEMLRDSRFVLGTFVVWIAWRLPTWTWNRCSKSGTDFSVITLYGCHRYLKFNNSEILVSLGCFVWSVIINIQIQ